MRLPPALSKFIESWRCTVACPPVMLGLVGCGLLFLARTTGALDALSANAQTPGYDFFGLPRCGLALRLGTSIADSWKEMPFGPYSTDWASHPMMCLVLGVPLSSLPPWVAYWTFAAFLLLLQVLCLVVAARWANLSAWWPGATRGERARLFALFLLCGVFFPQYVLLNQAQYHGLSMLFVLLALRRGTQVGGFVGSALSKPLLAPAGLLVLADRDFRSAAKIVLLSLIGTLPFLFLGRTAADASGSVFDVLGRGGWLKLKYSVMNWNQEMSLSKVFERFMDAETNFHLRVGIAVACLGTSLFTLLEKKEREIAVGLAVLAFMLLYGRGHEYHFVTLLPAIVFVGSRRGGASLTLLLATLLLALPSTWLLVNSHRLQGQGMEINHMMDVSPVLGWSFVLQKPLGLLLLWAAFLGASRTRAHHERAVDAQV